ncbi:neprilysin-4 isoform X2 [Teleopsis dalmanni]|nr:neprilysin-4 isoform X2 [Teleopsis dalmanni]
MLPITLMLILVMRMDNMLLALHLQKKEIRDQPIYMDYYDNALFDSVNDIVTERITPPFEPPGILDEERLKRCLSLKFGLSETIDIEDRDIMKDARTSFLPKDTTAIPRECFETFNIGNSFRDLDYEDPYDVSRTRSRRTLSVAKADSSTSESDSDYYFDPFSNEDEASIIEQTSSLQSFWNEQGTKDSIRMTQANTMKRYMDTSVDPCNDFYKYACGNWEKLHPIPKDKAGFDTFEMLRESLDAVLKLLLEANDESLNNNKQKHKILHIQDNNFDHDVEVKSDIASSPATSNGAVAAASERVEISEDAQKSLKERETQLRKQIVSRRDELSRLLMRYKRQLLISGNKQKSIATLVNVNSISALNPLQPIKPKTEDNSNTAQLKAKYLYRSCINSRLLNKRGIEPLITLINKLGGWPVLDPNWDGSHFDWLNLTAQLRRYNNDIMLVQWVGPDIKNSDENIIQFDQTSLGLPTREYFLQDMNRRYLQAYQRFMSEVMQKLGASQEIAVKTAAEIVGFETQLAGITSPADQRLNVTKLYKRMTLKQLHEIVPEINWVRYLTILQERNVQDSEQIVVYAMDYMQELVSLLATTQPRTVSNYILWRFVRHRINNVDDRFEDIKQNFYHTLFGREESPSRWKVCIAQVNTNMGMALGSMFVKKYFDENSKRDTLRMTHELQQAFRDVLKTTDWLDPTTKHLAELKVNAMSLKIGYPDFILNQAELNEKYAGIEIHPEKYFENTLNVLLHTSKIEQGKLQEAVNKTTWQTAPAIVNAYYSRNKNQIMFPAGILQPPFYHRHFPRALNFGGIGVVIGHELTHGFDDKGRLFDKNGSIHKWWTDSAIKGFDERARCIIAQYSNYTVGEVGISLNGESTQGENIADNGGLRQAFHAYKRWLVSNPQEASDERLPGIDMSGEQLFFLNFGQVWCGAMRPEAVRNKLNTAIHSPGRFRVIGTLSNSNDFAREFRCPRGSPMNPVHKCSVW